MDEYIVVMDSGVGGLSVLREMLAIMPQEDFYYFGDSANAPYGTKSTEEVRGLVLAAVERFLRDGAKAIAIACNTATSAAVKRLRELYPAVPLVGIEPALKPAAQHHPHGKILVMATLMTIREEKFRTLLARYENDAEVIPLACPGLMEYVEDGRGDSEEVEEFLRELLAPYADGSIAAVVLGCTHYPFVRHRIEDVLGERVAIYDGGAGTARELRRRLAEADLLRPGDGRKGRVVIENSLPDPAKIALSERLLYGREIGQAE